MPLRRRRQERRTVPPDLRERWCSWWRRRPFAAGLVLGAAGAEVLPGRRAGPAAPATGGLRYLVPRPVPGRGLPVPGDPRRRRLWGTAGVLASLASWVESGLGGLLLGAAPGTGAGRSRRGGRGDGEAAGPRGRAGPAGAPTVGPQFGAPAWGEPTERAE
ncbi:DUF6114 domain-containing protein [Streptomyces roseolus]|uniref:DUF6114 domain-containing protein n=1 Tax=Streptomyces roseolus TaxID=67358 RepID=UPI0033F57154